MTKNNNVLYPIILTPEENDVFVQIPDIPGGFTQGNNTLDAIQMAEDAIGNLLEDVAPKDYPNPSDPKDIKLKKNQKLVYVSTDLNKFRNKYPRKVRRNVTVPAHLNNLAKDKHINVSKLLTQALQKELNG